MKLHRPSVGSVTLSLLVAAWLALVTNNVFWRDVATAFGEHMPGLAAFSIGIVALLAADTIAVSVKYLTKPIFILLIVSAASAGWFMEHFGVIIDTDMIRNAVQTTPAEAGHLLTPAYLWHMLVYAVLPSLLIVFVRIRHRPFPAKLKYNLAVIVPFLLLTLALVAWQYPAIASTMRNNRLVIKTLNPVSPIISAVKFVIRSGQESVIVAAPLDSDARLGAAINKAEKPVLTIIVVGETARAQEFSLGGYERKTNPELEKRDIAYFPNTSSCGTATAVSMPCMFSALTRSEYSHEKALAQENLVDVLSHAGVNVEWWDNNTGDKKIGDRIVKRKFYEENDPRFCNEGECLDTVMVNALGAWLDGIKGNSVLVMHQLGSHGPAYFARYSEEERAFRPDCRTAEFADCTQQEIINAYDNTIVATDRMLAAVIDMLQARSDQIASTMVYISDHGESLGEKGLYLHGMPYIFAPDEQTRVPFLMWASKGYTRLFGLDTACLREQADAPYSQDNLFHTVLGLMDVQARHYQREQDISARCRSPLS
ncbi:phosphoethanolamine--lipid A transferase [Hoeflea sp. G2-23]|uniref:Phosphoethanolamine--lipid A transferase n=1 Tax=Hoeflea algicola TaxID=2983763 RepID=A0ABT3Z6V9_9HYPH|nr:phosphoethanolamine--lipid A transferase [Hoeflea algicola]MCY0147503.1 phosphoethanolamine--lipid A transferase [Hoeflea algicola]